MISPLLLPDLTSTFERLNARFGLRNEGPLTAFLSYEITRDRSARTLTLHQQSYISSILSAAHMDHWHLRNTLATST